ncbi:MAG: 3-ketoacyl-ACP reductase [Pelagibacteraceae bacterium]|nr:3-ketoacyl-ACP reductase [Pelagibacteraceae bacterium]
MFKNKVVIITGGGSGIGKSIAKLFSKNNAIVCVTDIDIKKAEETSNECQNKSFFYNLDVTNKNNVKNIFNQIHKEVGFYDILISNAGVSNMKYIEDITEDDWNFNMNVNAKGVFLCNQEAIKYFKNNKIKGRIVNTASLASKIGAPLLAHYSASKFAVVGFTQAAARETAKYGIRINAVCPGFVKTSMQEREVKWEAKLRNISEKQVIDDYINQTPLGRLEEPEDVAKVVLFLSSDESNFMTGQAINVTGGIYTT